MLFSYARWGRKGKRFFHVAILLAKPLFFSCQDLRWANRRNNSIENTELANKNDTGEYFLVLLFHLHSTQPWMLLHLTNYFVFSKSHIRSCSSRLKSSIRLDYFFTDLFQKSMHLWTKKKTTSCAGFMYFDWCEAEIIHTIYTKRPQEHDTDRAKWKLRFSLSALQSHSHST